ncbi:MAG: hypothetical protein WA020_07560 [Candidatus Acidiferrales bacterium]
MSMDFVVRLSKRSFFLAACCLIFCSRLAFANPVTYTYNQDISGSFTVPSSLGDNFEGFVTPASFSFTDGSLTISSGESFAIDSFFVNTNGSGAITDWNILLVLVNEDVLETTCCVSGFAITLSDDSGVFTETNGTPGVWSADAVGTAEEPSSIFLLGAGLLGLGPFIRRALAMP